MPIRQLDDKSVPRSPFSDWLRTVGKKHWDSHLDGIRVYDIDWCVWKKEDDDFGDGPFMLFEEKQFYARPRRDQAFLMYKLDKILKADLYYKGFHLLQFEKNHPSNGDILLDEEYITYDDFITFWQFGAPDKKYISWFDKLKEKDVHWKQHVHVPA